MVGRRWQREGIDLTLVPFETPQDTIEALVQNQDIDAILVDSVTLRQAQAAGAALSAAGAHVTSNPYVIVVPRRAYELLEQTNSRTKAAADGWRTGNTRTRVVWPAVNTRREIHILLCTGSVHAPNTR